jgi:hypothetical protein
MKRIVLLLTAMLSLSMVAFTQPRPMDKTSKPVVKAPAPASFPAKYEGGMFGYGKKHSGTLKFDDDNSRLVFYGEDRKELFGLPYASLLVIYPQSKSVTSTTGNVIRSVPLPGNVLGGFIKENRRYLILQFDDPDVDARGTVNFKIEDKELLDSVLTTLADKAGLQARGDAYYRPRTAKSDN